MTVIPGPPLFSLKSSYLTRSPAVWSSSKISNEFLHTGRECIEGIPPGTISAAFVLWATQLDQVRVHSDEFVTGTVRRVVGSQRKAWPTDGPAPSVLPMITSLRYHRSPFTTSIRPALAFIMISGEGVLTCSDHTGSPLSHPCLPCEVWVDGKAGTPGHTIHPSTPGYSPKWIRRQLSLRVVGSAV